MLLLSSLDINKDMGDLSPNSSVKSFKEVDTKSMLNVLRSSSNFVSFMNDSPLAGEKLIPSITAYDATLFI